MSAAAREAAHDSVLTRTLTALMGDLEDAPVRIENLRRLAGGAAHETWAFDACRGAARSALVLRRDYPDPLLPGDLTLEYALLQSLTQAGIPVASPRWCDDANRYFDTPAMIVARVAGSDLRKALAAGSARRQHADLAQSLVALQASIHALDPGGLPLPPRSAGNEVERWAHWVVTQRTRRPLLDAALAWLRAHLPTPVSPSLLHGDFKANNLLVDDAGKITVIDWEMAHLGDPLEDLAWTLLWTTSHDLVGGLLSREAYLASYVALSGRPVDEARLRFWVLFALFKLAAIFICGAPDTGSMSTARPVRLQLRRALPWLESRLAQGLVAELPRATTI